MPKLKVLCLVLLLLPAVITGQQNIDSLQRRLNTSDKVEKINTLNELSYALSTSEYDKSLEYAIEALKLSEQQGYLKGIADAHWNLGDNYCISSEYTKAIEHTTKALEIYSQLKIEEKTGFTLNLLGTIYQELALYDKALDYFMQARKVYEKNGIEAKMASIFSNISIIYSIQGRFDLSREYYRKALKIDLKNKNYSGVAISYANIANTYLDEKQFRTAVQYYDSIVPLLIKTRDYYSLGSVYNLFGGIYFELNKSDKAIELFNLSIETSLKVNDLSQILNTYVALARVYYDNGNLNMSFFYGEKALNLAKQVKRNYSYASVYSILTKINSAKGDYKKALECQEKFIQYNDSLKQNELSQKLLSIQTQYETERKEQQINSLHKENDLKNTRLSRQRVVIFLVVITLLLSILLLVFILNRYRLKHQANKALEQKNQEIETQKQQIVEINHKLSLQASELKKLDEAKSRFFTNISHEFRTPLTLITGPLEVLISQTTDEQLNTEYNLMLRQAKRLLTLVNQLLELSKLEKGVIRLVLTYDDFNRFIRTLTGAYTSLAKELKIELFFQSPNQELNIWFDKDKVEKIITNLISNAFKFTPTGGKIAVSLIENSETGMADIVISDTGTGIAQEHLRYIFDPFYQASSATNKTFEGTGIGLALVKEFVHLHHGKISVNSKPGTGSDFKVQLPLEISVYAKDEFFENETVAENSSGAIIISDQHHETQNEGDEPAVSPSSRPFTDNAIERKHRINGRGKTIILIVEDNEDMRRYITRNLPDDYQVLEATDGKQGIEKANEVTPDIIIADIMMPNMDGIEMVRILKNDERTSHIPVIFLTAKASDESRFEGLETCADDYITKPFNVRELSLKIRNQIFSRQKLREKFEKSISVEPSELAQNSIDEQFLQRALQIIEKNIDNFDYNAEKFAEDIGMSRSTLHRKLIALTNQPATEFIRTIRLKRAAQLLSKNTASVSEIAYQTGFGNLSYFTKCFKEQFGKNPSEYAR